MKKIKSIFRKAEKYKSICSQKAKKYDIINMFK